MVARRYHLASFVVSLKRASLELHLRPKQKRQQVGVGGCRRLPVEQTQVPKKNLPYIPQLSQVYPIQETPTLPSFPLPNPMLHRGTPCAPVKHET